MDLNPISHYNPIIVPLLIKILDPPLSVTAPMAITAGAAGVVHALSLSFFFVFFF
jgi:hypothetical protein